METSDRMDAREESLLQVANALPDQFEFYHLGQVSQQPSHAHLDEVCAIAFYLSGDVEAIMILLFSKQLDSSLYSELGNILASQMATQLSNKSGMDLHISPPQKL